MSLNFANSWIQHQGNNSTSTPYEVTFAFHENEDLRVVVTTADGMDTILSPGDFTATGAGQETGGSLVTAAPYDHTHKVTIYREVEATQKTVYEENADFPAKSHERALDKLTMLGQQLLRHARRSLRFRESDGEALEIPKVPNSVLTIGAGGQPAFLTSDELASFLDLEQQFFDRPIKTFADAAERVLAVPEFVGQLGTQRDAPFPLWIATGASAGNWAAIPIPAGYLTLAMMPDGFLAASAAGRAKMADAFITLAKIGAGIFTADTNGRGKFASGFVDSSLLASGAALANLPTGAIVQVVTAEYTVNADLTTPIAPDDTIPQNTEGTQIISLSITPKAATNKILALFQGQGCGGVIAVALFRDAIANAIAAAPCSAVSAASPTALNLMKLDSPATTSAIDYRIRIGGASTTRLNGTSSGRYYGGASVATLTLIELKA